MQRRGSEKSTFPAISDFYYEARNDYTNNSETILLCNRCVCNGKINSQTINLCVMGAPTEKAPCADAQFHKRIPARTPCVTDGLCDWEINSQIIQMCVCVIILGPIVKGACSRGIPQENPLNSIQNLAIPAAIYRSAPGPGPESAPRSAF